MIVICALVVIMFATIDIVVAIVTADIIVTIVTIVIVVIIVISVVIVTMLFLSTLSLLLVFVLRFSSWLSFVRSSQHDPHESSPLARSLLDVC